MMNRLVQFSPIPAFLACFALLASASHAGVVTSTNNAGAGSLRQAISDAVSGDTITFAPALDSLAIVLTNELSVTKSLNIDASALSNGITIDGNDTTRVLLFHPGITNTLSGFTIQNGNNAHGGGINNSGDLTLNHMTLTGNHAAQVGGAIRHYDGRLTLNHTTVSDNTAPQGAGLHIENNGAAVDGVLLNNSTVAGNSASGNGGGIYQNVNTIIEIKGCTLSGNEAINGGGIHSQGTLTLHNSTLSGNAADDGGGIYGDAGTLTLHNSTLAGNTATDQGGGIYKALALLHLKNTIVASNSFNDNIAGYINSQIASLTDGDPGLAPLGAYGGPTQTMPPLPSSPAIDDGLTSATNSLTDQRGFARVAGTDVDIGAVEFTLAVIVTSLADSGSGSLRDAILSSGSGASITFTNTLAGQTILLTSGQLLIDKNLDIDASAIGGITIDGNGGVNRNRVLEITAGNTISLNALTITGGRTANGPDNTAGGHGIEGGGILNAGHLTLFNCTIFNNAAGDGGAEGNVGGSAGWGGDGGGIYNTGTLTLENSTLSSNFGGDGGVGHYGGGGGRGGGIYNTGILTLENSTLSGNTSGDGGRSNRGNGDGGDGGDGGGICTISGSLTLKNSTLSRNTSGDGGTGGRIVDDLYGDDGNDGRGGGIFSFDAAFNSTNSIVAGNTATTDANIWGPMTAGSNNLTSGDPGLAALGDYGGPTQTMPPLPGSPAIDAGLTVATNNLIDQRGMPRVLASGPAGNPVVDIGAVEYSGWLVGADLSGMDTNPLYIPAGSIYDSATIFPSDFDPAVAGLLEIVTTSDKADLIATGETNVTSDPEPYGLYNESAFQALALDRPFLTYNAVSNSFTLTIGILETPDLVSAPFTNLTGFTTMPYPGDGEIDIEFTPPNTDARFYEIYGAEPSP